MKIKLNNRCYRCDSKIDLRIKVKGHKLCESCKMFRKKIASKDYQFKI